MKRLSRRDLALALLSLAAFTRPAAPQSPSDRGIGGTGAAPRPPTVGDRGIGGTGVIGTIRKFGSIYVNGLRIAYAGDVEVFIDGLRARPEEMKIGHIAQTLAFGPDQALRAKRIEIASEVVGPIEQILPNGVVVLGQSIDLRALRRPGDLRIGAFVAVSGQRRPNGVIVASLIEQRSAGQTELAGPVQADKAGRLSIGGLSLRGLPAALAGSRVRIKGSRQGEAYSVSSFHSLARPFGPEVRRISIEGYVAPEGGRLGSGLFVAGALGGKPGASALSVISGRVSASGALAADTVRRGGRLEAPDSGAPVPLKSPSGSLPGLGGENNLLGGSNSLLPGLPGGGTTPGLGLPGGGGLAPPTNLGAPGGIGLPGLRR